PGCPCFPPGTLVLMADGSSKPIQDIRTGDWVLARDPDDEAQPARPHQVLLATTNRTHRLVEIAVRGPTGDVATIEATGEHPFWTRSAGWIAAAELKPGDALVDKGGDTVRVTATALLSVDSTTHNLNVDGTHTFFVVADGISLLVHNVDPWD